MTEVTICRSGDSPWEVGKKVLLGDYEKMCLTLEHEGGEIPLIDEQPLFNFYAKWDKIYKASKVLYRSSAIPCPKSRSKYLMEDVTYLRVGRPRLVGGEVRITITIYKGRCVFIYKTLNKFHLNPAFRIRRDFDGKEVTTQSPKLWTGNVSWVNADLNKELIETGRCRFEYVKVIPPEHLEEYKAVIEARKRKRRKGGGK